MLDPARHALVVGETEVSLWATDRRGKSEGHYDAQDYKLEVERGITAQLRERPASNRHRLRIQIDTGSLRPQGDDRLTRTHAVVGRIRYDDTDRGQLPGVLVYVKISMTGSTIPHAVIGRYGAGKVLLKPASEGTGVIAGGPVRAILESAGIQNILTKSLGTANPHNVVKATFEALKQLHDAEQYKALRRTEESAEAES